MTGQSRRPRETRSVSRRRWANLFFFHRQTRKKCCKLWIKQGAFDAVRNSSKEQTTHRHYLFNHRNLALIRKQILHYLGLLCLQVSPPQLNPDDFFFLSRFLVKSRWDGAEGKLPRGLKSTAATDFSLGKRNISKAELKGENFPSPAKHLLQKWGMSPL